MFEEKQQDKVINSGLQQELTLIRKCKQEMEGEYLKYAWKKGHLDLVLGLISQDHEIGYMRDMLALTARLQMEKGIKYPDAVNKWVAETRVQLPELECGTWALDLNPLLAYDAIHWIIEHGSEMFSYEVQEGIKRINEILSKDTY